MKNLVIILFLFTISLDCFSQKNNPLAELLFGKPELTLETDQIRSKDGKHFANIDLVLGKIDALSNVFIIDINFCVPRSYTIHADSNLIFKVGKENISCELITVYINNFSMSSLNCSAVFYKTNLTDLNKIANAKKVVLIFPTSSSTKAKLTQSTILGFKAFVDQVTD